MRGPAVSNVGGLDLLFCDGLRQRAARNRKRSARLGPMLVRASTACAKAGCGQDADGFGGWHDQLRPGAMAGAQLGSLPTYRYFAHLVLDRCGCQGRRAAAIWVQQAGEQLPDRAADGGDDWSRGKAGWTITWRRMTRRLGKPTAGRGRPPEAAARRPALRRVEEVVTTRNMLRLQKPTGGPRGESRRWASRARASAALAP